MIQIHAKSSKVIVIYLLRNISNLNGLIRLSLEVTIQTNKLQFMKAIHVPKKILQKKHMLHNWCTFVLHQIMSIFIIIITLSRTPGVDLGCFLIMIKKTRPPTSKILLTSTISLTTLLFHGLKLINLLT
jgi:hypothetical protein